MDTKQLGLRIKCAREDRDLSIDEVAREIGVNKSTISRYERGEIERPKLPVIYALADILCVNPSWLIGKDDNRTFTPRGMDLASFRPCNLFSALRSIRKSFGYTTNDVAFRIGISEQDYIAIENGRDTSCLILSRLAVLFSCSTDHILSFDGVIDSDSTAQQTILSVLPGGDASNYHILSSQEAELLRMYRNLDERGKTSAYSIMKGLHETQPGDEANFIAKKA